jgi:hypothetical protein
MAERHSYRPVMLLRAGSVSGKLNRPHDEHWWTCTSRSPLLAQLSKSAPILQRQYRYANTRHRNHELSPAGRSKTLTTTRKYTFNLFQALRFGFR